MKGILHASLFYLRQWLALTLNHHSLHNGITNSNTSTAAHPNANTDEMFCSNIRSAAANAGMVMERLSDHSRRAALSPSLLLDSDWQESATFIGLDMESAGYLLHQVEFSPRSQHLRHLVGDIASLFETVGAMYGQSVSSLSIAEVEQIGQPLEELGFLAEDLAHALESICG